MKTKILLNGVGRIGKAILKQLLQNDDFEILAINEINPYIDNIVYSINYDSTYGNMSDKFKVVEDNFIQNSKAKIKISNYKTLHDINLGNIDVIIDSNDRIKVIDQGHGIPPEQQEKVLNRFCTNTTTYTESKSSFAADQYSSTGLGLAIASRITQAHGGRIYFAHTEEQQHAVVIDMHPNTKQK